MFREAIGLATVNGTPRPESASYDADFLFPEPAPVIELGSDIDYVLELLTDRNKSRGRAPYIEAVADLQTYLHGRLRGYNSTSGRERQAIFWAERYRDYLETVETGTNQDQASATTLAKVYLSAVSATANLREFIAARKWLKKHQVEYHIAKYDYLDARGRFQTDVDELYDHFEPEASEETLLEVLHDTVNTARILVRGQPWVDSSTAAVIHEFLGSVLSERAVVHSLRQNVHPGARYGSPPEDGGADKADAVIPLRFGILPVQVKMTWLEPTEFIVRPNKITPHVYVPQHVIRGGLNSQEDEVLAVSMTDLAESERWAA